LLAEASLETTAQPRAIEHVAAAGLAPATRVYITALPGDDAAMRIAAALRLRDLRLTPVPHLSARGFASAAELEQSLDGFAAAGVREALLIGGDIDRPRGPFASARDLIATGLLERHGFTAIGIAAYPEGHPRIAAETLEAELAAKIEGLRQRGIAPFIVTQFCFEAEPIVMLLARDRAKLADVPLHLGLAGPAKPSTLLRYAVACGIGNSLRAVRRKASFAKLLVEAGPEPIIAALAAEKTALDNIAALHFFTFGGVERTARWATDLAAATAAEPALAPSRAR
jgi:methylenetetrahydrofolate reductase (NADH)